MDSGAGAPILVSFRRRYQLAYFTPPPHTRTFGTFSAVPTAGGVHVPALHVPELHAQGGDDAPRDAPQR